ncbi:MAG: VWA domain-containing protein [Gemmatimonadetes bacterium]|nr:VWA domain-containing protein [Gemmatimonadota bacterium]MDA1103910.1 VWA domain-containing protein [Gemmatimonadota bacterium]
MTFSRPDLLIFGPAAVLLMLTAIVAQWRRTRRLVDAYGGVKAARRLTGRSLDRFPWVRAACLLIAASGLTIAAAGPEREAGQVMEPVTPVDLVVTIDVSLSMSANDVAGGRLGRAKELLDRLTEALPADRIAVSLFADWPYRLIPLTDDPAVVTFFTPSLAPELMALRDQGTSLASAITHAQRTLEARPRPEVRRIVLLVTDGESHGQTDVVMDSVSALVSLGTTLWTAGVGTAGGAPLYTPGSDGAPLLDPAGEQVVAGYDPSLLAAMASAGGGEFHDISDDGGVRALVRALGDVSGTVEADDQDEAPLPWLPLLVLPLLLWDAVSDSGRRLVRLPFGKAA